jgi:hypothetical protein
MKKASRHLLWHRVFGGMRRCAIRASRYDDFMNLLPTLPALALLAVFAQPLFATTETQRQYRAGRDKDNIVPWKFLCTSGAYSGVWTNLPVPSHWDVKGFGTLTYKQDAPNARNERGLYEHNFAVPADWNGTRVFLLSEGVMIDTSAKLNGEGRYISKRGAAKLHRARGN